MGRRDRITLKSGTTLAEPAGPGVAPMLSFSGRNTKILIGQRDPITIKREKH